MNRSCAPRKRLKRQVIEMNTAELLALCQSKGISVGVVEGRLKVLDPDKRLDASLLALLREHKVELIAFFTQSAEYTASDFPHSRLSTEEVGALFKEYPDCEKLYIATPLQAGLLFHGLWDESGVSYTSQSYMELTGRIEMDLLQKAWQGVVDRHDILRTCFVGLDNQNVHQLVRRQVTLPVETEDWRGRSEVEQKEGLKALHGMDKRQGFDFSQAPLMRITLVRLSEERLHFLWTYHHILLDGWCVPLLLDEVLNRYRGLQEGKVLVPQPVVPYERYIGWLMSQDEGQAKAFWRERLSGIEAPTHFIHDLPVSVEAEDDFGVVGFVLPVDTSGRLQALAKASQTTMNSLLQGAWSYLLHRYSDSERVMFGTVVSGRPAGLAGVEKMLGLFINTIPVVVDVDLSQSLGIWLGRIHAENVKGDEYSFLSLSDIQRLTDIPVGTGLFDSLLVYENLPGQQGGSSGEEVGFGIGKAGSDERTEYALLVRAKQQGGRLECEFHYHGHVLPEVMARQMLGHFEWVLEQMGAGGEARLLGELTLLRGSERQQMLVEWNRSGFEHETGMCIHTLFERQVASSPDAVALVFEGEELSYGELNARSNRLSHYLLTQGVTRETLVGVCTGRSFDVAVAVLAVLKAGGAYVPLEPDYPAQRLGYMVSDAGLDYLLTQKAIAGRFDGMGIGHVIAVDDSALQAVFKSLPSENVAPDVPALGGSLCYVIYTSGSTGEPKGVMAQHDGVLNRFYWMWRQYPVQEGDVFCSKTALGFVDSVWELFGGLLKGRPTVLMSRELVLDTQRFMQSLSERAVTRLVVVPSMLEVLMEDEASFGDCIQYLTHITVSGEKLSPRLVKRFVGMGGKCQLLNLYGSSEVAADVTYYEVTKECAGKSFIGRPIDNMQVYVLDGHLRPCALGVPGELYVAGPGVARGYLHREGLTQERFIADPFVVGVDKRMFRTGDRVRFMEDGNLEFLGRVDHQIKLRGMRIELGEIEYHLTEHPIVDSSLVIAYRHEHKSNNDEVNDQLVAYIKLVDLEERDSVRSESIESIRESLQDILPDYMVPSAFVVMDEWPLTPNGKLDHAALPAPGEGQSSSRYQAPETETERVLVSVWAALLHREEEQLGINDNFFSLGGHSLLTVRMTGQIRNRFNQEVSLKQIFSHPTIAQLAVLIDTEDTDTDNHRPGISRIERGGLLPLSFAQQRLWMLDQIDGGSAHYNMPTALRFEGALDIEAVKQALAGILMRHEVLRTVFVLNSESEPSQQILDGEEFSVPLTDFSGEINPTERAREQVIQQASTPFNLSRDYMLRAEVLRITPEEHWLLVTLHHIASDGWSMDVMAREFFEGYSAFVEGRAVDLPSLAVQYADYAHWQREWLQGEVLEIQLNYWQGQLEDVPMVHGLALDYPRSEYKQYQGAQVSSSLPTQTARGLMAVAQQYQLTPFMLLHAALSLVLSRHSNSQDIVIGTPVANRVQLELEPLIGFFVNTLVLRVDTGHRGLSDYLGHIRQVHIDAQSHQDVPFEHLVERLDVSRSTAHTPLFQIMLTTNTNYGLHSEDELAKHSIAGVAIRPLSSEVVQAKFDLEVDMSISEQGAGLIWTYDTSLFSATHIEQLNGHLMNLLESLSRQVGVKSEVVVSSLAMLSETETDYLLNGLNDTQSDYPADKCLHELFEKQAEEYPQRIALVFEGTELSYGELNARSNRLAHYLRAEHGVGPECLVGICMERSLEMVIAILGIHKAGGAYVPLDPGYPAGRLAYMLEDTDMGLVLSQSGVSDALNGYVGKRVYLDGLGDTSRNLPAPFDLYGVDDIPVATIGVTPTNMAYVIYTSGSTGKPKGVMVRQQGLMNYVCWAVDYYQLSQLVGSLMHSSLSFDATITSLFAPLLSGGFVELIPEENVIERLHQELTIRRNKSPKLIKITPAHLQVLIEKQEDPLPDNLSVLVVGGDNFPLSLAQRWRQQLPKARIINEYGPTETVVGCSLQEFDQQDFGSFVLIGRAIANTQLYILDSNMQPVAQGAIAELYIGGDGVAAGYLNRPELTDEKFVSNPFGAGKLYRSGDLAQITNEGLLVCHGRIDSQVKIRGFRIELGEIEYHLTEHPIVDSSLVIAYRHEHKSNNDEVNDQLVAYIKLVDLEERDSVRSESIESIRESLQDILPDYMVPSAFVVMDEWPLTPNGKLDHAALPAPGEGQSSSRYQAPETETERVLVSVWAALLHREEEQLGINDNFFSLGGHSLLTVRMTGQIRNRFNQEVSLKQIFSHPTIAQLAVLIDTEDTDTDNHRPGISRIERGGLLPLSFAQQRLWMLDQIDGGSAHYNMPTALRFEGALDIEAVKQALAGILMRHEVLRTVFVLNSESEPSQQILDGEEFSVPLTDFSGEINPTERAREQVIQQASTPFNLSRDYMLRAEVLRITPEEHWLLVTLHHIASDGWSMDVMAREFFEGYSAFVEGRAVDLPSLAVQYADYAHWQREWLQGEVLEIQLNYWQGQLEDVPMVHGLALDYPRSEYKQYQGAQVSSSLPTQTARGLMAVAQKYQLTPFMLLHAALSLVLSRHSNSQDIVIGTPVANRVQLELEPLIGFFVNTLVLRVDTGHRGLSDYLGHIRQVHIDAQSHQDVPFEHLVERLDVSRSTAHTPLFQIMLTTNTNYGLHSEDELAKHSIAGVAIRPLSSEVVQAKFDLEVDMSISEQGAGLIWTYDTSLFSATHIEQLNGHLMNLLESLSRQVGVKSEVVVSSLAMLSETETDYLLNGLNDTQSDYPADKCLHELFEKQAEEYPQRIALVFEGTELSYGELNARSNRLAHYLRAEHGVGPECLVGICMERSLEMVIAILGIHKAGGAYVPLDPGYPAGRLAYMLEDTDMGLVLSQSGVSDALNGYVGKRVYLDGLGDTSRNLPAPFDLYGVDDIPVATIGVTPTNMAYVIYTSGSTGKPKGVMVEHGGVVNKIYWRNHQYPMQADDRLLQKTPYSFDVSIWEFFWPLTAGGCLVLAKPEGHKDPDYIKALLEQEAITIVHFVPSMLQTYIEVTDCQFSGSVRYLFCSGEALGVEEVRQIHRKAPNIALNNLYGPTEASIEVTEFDTSLIGEMQHVPIGKAIHNIQVYVLDGEMNPVPEGCAGELHIGGVCLARGYLNRPDLTAESFVKNPFYVPGKSSSSERLYKTGDLVRFLPKGNLTFLGRIDHQVKIRGYRIELGEIESQIKLYPGIDSALVVAHDQGSGTQQLIAFVKLKDGETVASQEEILQMKATLLNELPEFMVPEVFILIEEWPLTASGKVDRKILLNKNIISGGDSYHPPDTQTQRELIDIWETALNSRNKIGIYNNFFQIGGHSLVAMKLVARINECFGVNVVLRDIFEYQTVAKLAELIDEQIKEGSASNLNQVTAFNQDDEQTDVEEFEL